jgi:hypothetical protein
MDFWTKLFILATVFGISGIIIGIIIGNGEFIGRMVLVMGVAWASISSLYQYEKSKKKKK